MHHYLMINGHKIFVDTQGASRGKELVFLHHGLGSTLSWRQQMRYFSQAGYRVVAYDRWGYGRSDFRGKFSMPQFEEDINDLKALVGELKMSHISLVGHSDGGSISLYFAAKYPDFVRSVISVAAHVYISEEMSPGIEGIKERYDREHDFKEKLQRVHGDKYDRVFLNWYSGWVNQGNLDWDMRDDCSRIRCRVFVMQGSNDEHASPQHARDITRAVPYAELCLVKGATHMLPQESPEIFNELAGSFLSGVYGR